MKKKEKLRHAHARCRVCRRRDPERIPDCLTGMNLEHYLHRLPKVFREASLCITCLMDCTCTPCNDAVLVAFGDRPLDAEDLAARTAAADDESPPRKCTVCGARLGKPIGNMPLLHGSL